MNPEIVKRQEDLQRLIGEVRRLKNSGQVGEPIVSQFVWYLCVRTSGYIEYSVGTILLEFYETRNEHPPLSDFVIKQLKLSREFPMRRVRDIVNSFRENRPDSREEFDYSKLDSTLESIQKNRNQIAHGGEAYSLSMSDLDTYFATAEEVINMVYEECNPSGS
ncbi:MAG: HEPN domain-containing protein [Chloroflexi bacterium]|nr:HEPN domain-containing protein [Chloroflexota bacterium]